MTLPVRVRSLDSSVALFVVLLFCAIGGVFSLFYFEIDDNQPLLTLRRRPEDPQLRYPTPTIPAPITKIPGEQENPPPSPAEGDAAAVPESHRWAPRSLTPPPPCQGSFHSERFHFSRSNQ